MSANKWRESASLLILSKDKLMKANPSLADYKVLLINRSEKASSFAKAAVFPGGVREQCDESPLWLEHFKKFGLQEQKLKELTVIKGPRPDIYAAQKDDGLARELSLRITAIRETFEEVGILFCKDRKSLENSNGFGSFQEDFDRKHWQRVVHKDPLQFLKLCQELNVIPDLTSLQEWSTWLTPAPYANIRFQVAFYMVPLLDTPNLVLEKNEVCDFTWMSPLEYLKAFFKRQIVLPPPQLYELMRLLNFMNLEELKDFAIARAKKGTIQMLPVQYKCSDGEVSIMPGDNMYPENPYDTSIFRETKSSMQQIREETKQLHRIEYRKKWSDAKFWLNFDSPDGHMGPIDIEKLKAML